MSEDEIDQMRSRFAREAMALMERTGEEVTRMRLAAELKIARSRLDVVFPEESDLLDAITGEWFAPYIEIMDEVMGSDLPPRRKMYEFVARRFVRLQKNFQEDPAARPRQECRRVSATCFLTPGCSANPAQKGRPA